MKKLFILLSILIYSSFICKAQIILPSIFADNMILQQNTKNRIWGKSIPGRLISVKTSWDNKSYSAKVSADSTWNIGFKTPKASNIPYSIDITCGEKRRLNNVLIGEVWFCGGQSNMEQPMKGFANQPIEGSTDDILNSTDNELRCYIMERQSEITPKFDCKGTWKIANPNTTPDFTATGYYYARILRKTLGVPVAIIHCNWGGSRIEAWMSKESLVDFPDKKIPQKDSDNEKKHQTPTVLFNGMIKPIIGYTIRGAIWYQGESNRLNYREYPSAFAAMHKDWQKGWDSGDFPIYFCQIAPYKYDGQDLTLTAYFREAQLSIAQKQANTGIAILMDTGERDCIHPAKKKQAGERLALQALHKTYNFTNLQCDSPQYESVEFKEGKAYLSFKYAKLGFTPAFSPIVGFEIAGEDKIFVPAKAIIEKGRIVVAADNVSKAKAVRYAFKNYVQGNLCGTNGLPISSFRTDNWDEQK